MQTETPENICVDSPRVKADTWNRIPQLDAVRGIAILIVVFHNYSNKLPALHLQFILRYGWMGVDLFFVLSGFLITGILVDSKCSIGYFRNFYARRCLRIWPLYYTVLFLMFAVIPVLRPSTGSVILARSSPWWAYPLFLQNFLIRHSSNTAGPLGVTWSVAIEEQFYLVWAVLVRYCSAVQLRWIAVLVICLSPPVRLYLALHNVELYTNIFCRLDGLMAGALIALCVRSDEFIPSRFLRVAWLTLVIALPLACAADWYGVRWIAFSFSSVASVSFVYIALFATQSWLRSALSNKFLIYAGIISYGLYLLHKIPLDGAILLHFDGHAIWTLSICLVVSAILAVVSWNVLEKPFLKLKHFFQLSPLPQH